MRRTLLFYTSEKLCNQILCGFNTLCLFVFVLAEEIGKKYNLRKERVPL